MKKEAVLLSYLKRNSRVTYTSTYLASYFNVSTRTIRNYVRKINDETPNLIIAESNGYTINLDKIKKIQNRDIENQRKIYILRRLIKNIDQGLDLYDLADSLYISDSTLRSTINFINKDVKKWQVAIKIKGMKVYITGNKYAIRHLLLNILDQSSFENFDLSIEIQEILGPNIKLEDLYKISLNRLGSEIINTYFLKNFVFHLSVALDRSSSHMQSNQVNLKNNKVVQLINDVQEKYSLYFLSEDLIEIEELFEQMYYHNSEIFTSKTQKFTVIINDALKEIEETYGIYFEDDDFKKRLIIHIQNLYTRVQKNKFSRNLSFEKIKAKYPILFDIGVFFASSLEKRLNIEINDDEIAFLTLHIGSFLKNEPSSDDRLKTIIVTPGYLNEGVHIANQVKQEFLNDLVVTDILDVDIFNQIAVSSDLLITNFPMVDLWESNDNHIKQVTVHDDILAIEKMEIWEVIKSIKSNRFSKELSELLNKKLNKKNFIFDYSGTTFSEIIKDIADILQINGSVSSDYYEQLMEREDASYTSFSSGIAIPHTLRMDAKKTDVVVMIPKEEILWGEHRVKLVIGLSINKRDRKIFNKLFERFVDIASEKENVTNLSKQNNLRDFIHLLIDMMSENNYYE